MVQEYDSSAESQNKRQRGEKDQNDIHVDIGERNKAKRRVPAIEKSESETSNERKRNRPAGVR